MWKVSALACSETVENEITYRAKMYFKIFTVDIPDKKYSFRNSNALPKSNVKQGDFIIVIESHKTHGLHGFVVHF